MPKDGKVKNKNTKPKQSQQAKKPNVKHQYEPSSKKVTTKGNTQAIKTLFERQRIPNNQTLMQSKTYKDAVLKELEWQKHETKRDEWLKPTSEQL